MVHCIHCKNGDWEGRRWLTVKAQKQPPVVFYKKSYLKDFAKFTGKHLHWNLFFNKVEGWQLVVIVFLFIFLGKLLHFIFAVVFSYVKKIRHIAPQVSSLYYEWNRAYTFFLGNHSYLSWHYRYLFTRSLILPSSPKMTKPCSHTGIWQRIYCYHHQYPICHYWFDHYAKVGSPHQYALGWPLILSWQWFLYDRHLRHEIVTTQ